MDEIKSVSTLLNYGKIVLSLDKVLEKRNITRNKLSNMIGVRFEVVKKLYDGNLERLDLDILSRICFVLDCNVSDLLNYQAPE